MAKKVGVLSNTDPYLLQIRHSVPVNFLRIYIIISDF